MSTHTCAGRFETASTLPGSKSIQFFRKKTSQSKQSRYVRQLVPQAMNCISLVSLLTAFLCAQPPAVGSAPVGVGASAAYAAMSALVDTSGHELRGAAVVIARGGLVAAGRRPPWLRVGPSKETTGNCLRVAPISAGSGGINDGATRPTRLFPTN